MTNYVFDNLSTIQNMLKKTDHIYLFLDYDGTLISFQDRPEDVFTPSIVTKILTQLISHPAITVCVISGRTLDDLKRLLPIKGLYFAGLHGIHIEHDQGKTFFWDQAKQAIPLLTEIEQKAATRFQHEQGLLIEDKNLSVAFHYRLLPERRKQHIIESITHFVQKIDANNTLQMIHGQQVIEFRPRGWSKGKAVSYLLNHHPYSEQILPVYIGDDTTDEDAFKEIKGKGIPIQVKNKTEKETNADYWLHNPDEVSQFLKTILSKTEAHHKG